MQSAKQIINSSSMPSYCKLHFAKLLETYGIEWHLELFNCEERIGSGSSGLSIDLLSTLDPDTMSRLQKTLNEFIEWSAQNKSILDSIPDDPLEVYSEFIEGLEYGDWENDFDDEKGFTLDILRRWHDERIDFYRSIRQMKLPKAREAAYKDIEAIDLGGVEEVCHTCGVFFYDNLDHHLGVEANYCSLDCQIKAKLICVQCLIEFEVGKSRNELRFMKLAGFCSSECNIQFKEMQNADNRYRSSMRQKATSFGVAYDDEITRRLVYEKADGVCYICKIKTHFESDDRYDPYLATVDHIIPWTKGGTHTWNNVALCCLRCNQKKKNNLLPQ